MRVTRDTFAAHREALIGAAAALFRQRGIENVSIGAISKSAGLSHGAFYGHFPSKDDLVEEACAHAMQAAAAQWRGRCARTRAEGGDALGTLIDHYLSPAHRDAPGGGCLIPALGAEIVRSRSAGQSALQAGIEHLLGVLAEEIALRAPDADAGAVERAAAAVLATMVGGLVLARAIADPERSRAVLEATASAARHAALIPS